MINWPRSKLTSRRSLLVIAAVIAIAASGLVTKISLINNRAPADHFGQADNINANYINVFMNQAGQSLIDMHQVNDGGWRFESAIQAPNFQTDRDVGAAGVGMGFLALAEDQPQNKRWINAAEQTAAWLIAVSSQDGQGGRYWRDFVNDNGASDDVYTSFDDGAIGIGDFFWQLFEQTGNPKYQQVAIETVQWTLSQAQPYSKDGLQGYRWKWNVTDPQSPYYMGMGEGAAGITYSLATYYERLKKSDPPLAARCKTYAEGSLNYIEIIRRELAKNIGTNQTIPEAGVTGQSGDTVLDSGYLSGAAGDAFMYLNIYKIFGDKQYLNDAGGLLNWLNDTKAGPMVKAGADTAAWRLAIDPQSKNDNRFATGVEEGSAGIGWTFLQAYGLTNDKAYLQTAEAAGNWLLQVAIKSPDGGLSWPEDENPANPLIHANLDNGAAGIGQFLRDLYLATGNWKYQAGADGALKWLMDSAKQQGRDIYWNDNGGSDPYSDDPSWHWGLAGIIEFVQRMNGGRQDIIGEQPGLSDIL